MSESNKREIKPWHSQGSVNSAENGESASDSTRCSERGLQEGVSHHNFSFSDYFLGIFGYKRAEKQPVPIESRRQYLEDMIESCNIGIEALDEDDDDYTQRLIVATNRRNRYMRELEELS